MSRNAGRRPMISGHIRTAGNWPDAAGVNSTASAVPSGVLIETSFSTTRRPGVAAPQATVQAPATAEEAALYRGNGHVEDRGRVLRAQPFDFAQHEHGAERVRQLPHGAFEQLADLLARNCNIRRVGLRAAHQRLTIVVQQRNTLLLEVTTAALVGPTAAERLVDRDPRQPSRKRRSAFEGADFGECGQIRSLHAL